MRPVLVVLVVAACGGSRAGSGASSTGASGGDDTSEDDMIAAAASAGTDREALFGPLEVGADFQTYRRVTDKPFLSQAHGNRWVDVWVNAKGVDAYVNTGEVPVGTVVVKTSWLDEGGKPGPVAGPIYIMEKRAAGYFPDHGDWYFAMHWAKPVGKAATRGPIYWRGKSPRVVFCYESCHDNYDRSLGGLVPSSMLPR